MRTRNLRPIPNTYACDKCDRLKKSLASQHSKEPFCAACGGKLVLRIEGQPKPAKKERAARKPPQQRLKDCVCTACGAESLVKAGELKKRVACHLCGGNVVTRHCAGLPPKGMGGR